MILLLVILQLTKVFLVLHRFQISQLVLIANSNSNNINDNNLTRSLFFHYSDLLLLCINSQEHLHKKISKNNRYYLSEHLITLLSNSLKNLILLLLLQEALDFLWIEIVYVIITIPLPWKEEVNFEAAGIH